MPGAQARYGVTPMTQTETETDRLAHAKENAKGWLQTIADWKSQLNETERENRIAEIEAEISELETAMEAVADKRRAPYTLKRETVNNLRKELDQLQAINEDEVRTEIEESPLSVRIRSGWYSPGETPEPEEAEILLSTGGPALRIMIELDEHKQPHRAWLEVQDWFVPWTEYYEPGAQDLCLWFASFFYYGD